MKGMAFLDKGKVFLFIREQERVRCVRICKLDFLKKFYFASASFEIGLVILIFCYTNLLNL